MRDSAENETVLIAADHHGRAHTLSALSAWRVMEVIRDRDIAIAAEDGGSGVRATCNVYVDEPWVVRLDPQSEDDRIPPVLPEPRRAEDNRPARPACAGL